MNTPLKLPPDGLPVVIVDHETFVALKAAPSFREQPEVAERRKTFFEKIALLGELSSDEDE